MAEDKFVDIEKTLLEKNPGLFKKMPNFILSYIKRIVHQEELNEIINERSHLRDGPFCESIVERFKLKINIHGVENIPKTGGCIIASNHALGGMDAMALIQEISKIRKDFKFIVNDVLLQIKSLTNTFMGVNKYGRNTGIALKEIGELYASDKAILIFPAGLVSRKINGKVQDLVWKKTFITRAKKHNKPIIPIFIQGQLSNFFYNLSNIRTKLGVKSNIELFYLSDEQFKLQRSTINIYVGPAIDPDQFDKGKTDLEWAQWVRKLIYTTLDPNSK